MSGREELSGYEAMGGACAWRARGGGGGGRGGWIERMRKEDNIAMSNGRIKSKRRAREEGTALHICKDFNVSVGIHPHVFAPCAVLPQGTTAACL